MRPKRYKLRSSAAAVLVFIALSAGTLGVQASPACQRIVKKYIERVTPHKFSKGTLARWAQWGKEHPNYHPPKRRPRLSPKETFDLVNFACEVPQVQPQEISYLLRPEPLPGFDLETSRPVDLVTIDTTKTTDEPTLSLIDAPLQVPPYSNLSDVPEPGTWLYFGTGCLLLISYTSLRRRSVTALR